MQVAATKKLGRSALRSFGIVLSFENTCSCAQTLSLPCPVQLISTVPSLIWSMMACAASGLRRPCAVTSVRYETM